MKESPSKPLTLPSSTMLSNISVSQARESCVKTAKVGKDGLLDSIILRLLGNSIFFGLVSALSGLVTKDQ